MWVNTVNLALTFKLLIINQIKMELPIELLEILNYQLSLIKEDKENNNNNFNQYNQFLFKLPLFLLFNLSIEASKEEEGGSLSHETINLVNNLLVNTLSNSKR